MQSCTSLMQRRLKSKLLDLFIPLAFGDDLILHLIDDVLVHAPSYWKTLISSLE